MRPDSLSCLQGRRRRNATMLYTQSSDLASTLAGLPDRDTVYRLVSFSNLTALSFLSYVARQTVVKRLDVSTFRVGPKALQELRYLGAAGQILDACFVLGAIMERDHRKPSALRYWDDLQEICARYGWRCASRDNHTKLMLMDTDAGQFVLESSCNLNEAPNWEQFIFSQDSELYAFYSRSFCKMLDLSRAGRDYVPDPYPRSKTCAAWADTKLEF